MHERLLPRLVVACVLVVGAVACTGDDEPSASPLPGAEDVAPGTPSQTGSTTAAPTPSATSPSPSPEPSPTPDPTGIGAVQVTAADGSELATAVAGDCLLSGAGLPPELEGSALADGVELLVGVDNFLGPGGAPTVEQLVVVEATGTANDARIRFEGGPVAGWNWWEGPIGSLELVDPASRDGVTVVGIELAATLERAERDQLGGRAPQPSPSPRRRGQRDGGRSGSGGPGGAGSPTPTSAAGDRADTTHARPVAQPASPATTSPTPPRAVDLRLELRCTAVG